MSNKNKQKLNKRKLKEIIRKVIDESNWFHDSEGEFSSEKDATSLSRRDIGQYEYPSQKDAFPCGRLSRSRDWCKAGKKPKKKPVSENETENQSDSFNDWLRAVITQAIERALAEPPTSSSPGGSVD